MGSAQTSKISYGELLKVPATLIQVNGHNDKEHSFAKEGEEILYSVPFRKLSAKTQVFHSNVKEHLRTRLTHTLEVARIAVNMAEALGFDARLTEAIALGHDMGHTPFGHVGERAIHRFSSGEDRKYTTKDGARMQMPEEMVGFKHNLQSVRLLTDYTSGSQFSNFVLYGIREHSSTEYRRLKERGKTTFYNRYAAKCSVVFDDGRQIPAWSVEAFLVKWADEIAQRHHDIEDAYYQMIMSPGKIVQQLEGLSELAEAPRLKNAYNAMVKMAGNYEAASDRERELFSHYLAEFVIGVYTSCSISEFENCLEKVVKKYHIANGTDFERIYRDISEKEMKEIFSLDNTPIGKKDRILNSGLKYAILDSYEVQRMDGRSEYIIRRLLRAYKSNPQQLPNMYINRLMKEELCHLLSRDDMDYVLERVKSSLGYEITPEGISKWQDYECRNALRILLDE